MSPLFATLPESRPAGRWRSPANAIASVVVHATAVTLAVVATATADHAPPPAAPTPDLIWVTQPPPLPSAAPRARSASGAAAGPRSDATRAASGALAGAIPRFDAPSVPALPLDGGRIDEPWGRGAAGAPEGTPPRGPDAGDVHSAPQVDAAAALLGKVAPRYPVTLRDHGVGGRVTLRFVVDTAGRVEAASVRVIASTHDLFADAARATLPTLRFTPASAAGRRVRQLVELPFTFEVRR